MRKECVVITSCQRNRWESWACTEHFRFIGLKVCLYGCASWYVGIFRAVQDTHGWDPEALKSLDHRTVEVESDLLRSSSPILPLKAGSTRKVAQDHISRDVDSMMFWATCASVGQPSQRKSVSLHVNGVFWVSVCMHCFLSSCWALLRRVWFCLLYYLFWDIDMHW